MRFSPGAVNSTPAHRLCSSVPPTCSPAGPLRRRRRRLETSQRCWDDWTSGDRAKYPTQEGEKTPYSHPEHAGKSEVRRPECVCCWSQKWIPTRLRAVMNLSAVPACSSIAEREGGGERVLDFNVTLLFLSLHPSSSFPPSDLSISVTLLSLGLTTQYAYQVVAIN